MSKTLLESAIITATNYLNVIKKKPYNERVFRVIIRDKISDCGEYWLLPYQLEFPLRNGKIIYLLAGNVPVKVSKLTGEIILPAFPIMKERSLEEAIDTAQSYLNKYIFGLTRPVILRDKIEDKGIYWIFHYQLEVFSDNGRRPDSGDIRISKLSSESARPKNYIMPDKKNNQGIALEDALIAAVYYINQWDPSPREEAVNDRYIIIPEEDVWDNADYWVVYYHSELRFYIGESEMKYGGSPDVIYICKHTGEIFYYEAYHEKRRAEHMLAKKKYNKKRKRIEYEFLYDKLAKKDPHLKLLYDFSEPDLLIPSSLMKDKDEEYIEIFREYFYANFEQATLKGIIKYLLKKGHGSMGLVYACPPEGSHDTINYFNAINYNGEIIYMDYQGNHIDILKYKHFLFMPFTLKSSSLGAVSVGADLNIVDAGASSQNIVTCTCNHVRDIDVITTLEKYYGNRFEPATLDYINKLLLAKGDGSACVLYGFLVPDIYHQSRAFKAVNQNGVIKYLDGQEQKTIDESSYKDFLFMLL